MVKFTNQHRFGIIKNYYRNSESVVTTLRTLTPIFGRNNRPTRQAVRAIVNKFESTITYTTTITINNTIGRSGAKMTSYCSKRRNNRSRKCIDSK